MKWIIACVFFLVLNGQTSAQATLYDVIPEQLAGRWKGTITQDTFAHYLSEQFDVELQIRKNRNTLRGISKIRINQSYAVFRFNGSVRGLEVNIREYKLLDSDIPDSYMWCLKKMILQFGFHKETYTLKGDWTGKGFGGNPCKPGRVELIKQTIRA